MPRAIWSGSITFGLVSIPVKLFTATEQKDVSFHQFEEGTGERVRNKRVAGAGGKKEHEVAYEDIVKGYEVSKGEYVIVTPDELESVEPTRSRTIGIEDFVDLEDIDPIYFEKTYFVAPASDAGAEKPFALLRDAMKETGKVGIATFVMRTKEYLATVRPYDDRAMVLSTMFFGDEIRDVGDLDLPGKARLSDKERRIAEQLIGSLATDFDPKRYADTYRQRVLELIEQKAAGKEIVTEEPEQAPEVGDLMEALRLSVESARQRGGASSPKKRSGSKRSTAKKNTAAKRPTTAKKKTSSRSKRSAA